jgi:hypothetical protein
VVGELCRRLGLIEGLERAIEGVPRARAFKQRRRGVSAGELVVAMAESMLVGGDAFNDLEDLRADRAGAELRAVPQVPAASTAARLARRLRPSHLRAAEAALAAAGDRLDAELGRDPSQPVTLDFDSTLVEVYGRKKPGASRAHSGRLAYQPLLGVRAERGRTLSTEPLSGSDSTRRDDTLALVRRSLALLPAGHGHLGARFDAGFYRIELLSMLRRKGVAFPVPPIPTGQPKRHAARSAPPGTRGPAHLRTARDGAGAARIAGPRWGPAARRARRSPGDRSVVGALIVLLDVDALAAVELVVAGAAVELVVTLVSLLDILPRATVQGVVAGAAVQVVVTLVTVKLVVALVSLLGVIALVADELVRPGAAVEVVVALASQLGVIARAASRDVVAGSGADDVVAASGGDRVGAGSRDDDVRPGGADDVVGVGGSDDGGGMAVTARVTRSCLSRRAGRACGAQRQCGGEHARSSRPRSHSVILPWGRQASPGTSFSVNTPGVCKWRCGLFSYSFGR